MLKKREALRILISFNNLEYGAERFRASGRGEDTV